jgi:hypothetical protein
MTRFSDISKLSMVRLDKCIVSKNHLHLLPTMLLQQRYRRAAGTLLDESRGRRGRQPQQGCVHNETARSSHVEALHSSGVKE